MSSRSPRGEGDRRALDGPDSRGPSRAPPEPSPRAAAVRRRRAHAATYARYACCMLRAAAGRCTRSHRRSRHPRTTPWSAVAAEVRAQRTARSRARATEKDAPPLTSSSASMGPSIGRAARPTSDPSGHPIDSSGGPSPQDSGEADSSCGAPTTSGSAAPAGQSAAAQSNTASHAGAALRAAAARSRWKRRRSRWTAARAHQGLRGGEGSGFGGGCRSRHPPSPRPEQPKQTPHDSRSGSVSAVASTAATGSAPSGEAGSVAAGAGAASHAPPAPPLSPPLKVADAVGDAGGAPTSRSGT